MDAGDRALGDAMTAFAQSAVGGGLPADVDALIAEASLMMIRQTLPSAGADHG